MTIATNGTGERQLYVSYISEVPVWKTTYRVVLPSKNESEPLLQGWAIVDNTVGEDWSNVELSLVAGRRSRLYSSSHNLIMQGGRWWRCRRTRKSRRRRTTARCRPVLQDCPERFLIQAERSLPEPLFRFFPLRVNRLRQRQRTIRASTK